MKTQTFKRYIFSLNSNDEVLLKGWRAFIEQLRLDVLGLSFKAHKLIGKEPAMRQFCFCFSNHYKLEIVVNMAGDDDITMCFGGIAKEALVPMIFKKIEETWTGWMPKSKMNERCVESVRRCLNRDLEFVEVDHIPDATKMVET